MWATWKLGRNSHCQLCALAASTRTFCRLNNTREMTHAHLQTHTDTDKHTHTYILTVGIWQLFLVSVFWPIVAHEKLHRINKRELCSDRGRTGDKSEWKGLIREEGSCYHWNVHLIFPERQPGQPIDAFFMWLRERVKAIEMGVKGLSDLYRTQKKWEKVRSTHIINKFSWPFLWLCLHMLANLPWTPLPTPALPNPVGQGS